MEHRPHGHELPTLLEEQRQGFRHGDECHAAADGHHDGLLDILVTVLHLEVHVECTHEHDDGSDSLHQVGYRSLIRGNFRRCLGEATCTSAGCPDVGAREQADEEHGYLLVDGSGCDGMDDSQYLLADCGKNRFDFFEDSKHDFPFTWKTFSLQSKVKT